MYMRGDVTIGIQMSQGYPWFGKVVLLVGSKRNAGGEVGGRSDGGGGWVSGLR